MTSQLRLQSSTTTGPADAVAELRKHHSPLNRQWGCGLTLGEQSEGENRGLAAQVVSMRVNLLGCAKATFSLAKV